MRAYYGLFLALVCALAGCEQAQTSTEKAQPAMQWDHAPEGQYWTQSTMTAIKTHGKALVDTVPSDIGAYCPHYVVATSEQRAAFWSGLLSSVARYESTWNANAVGGGGRWYGLTQIAPSTARGFGCQATSGKALKDGSANLSCAVRIAANAVARDGVVAAGQGGMASQWGPMTSSKTRQQIMAWTRVQEYCKAR